MYHYKVDVSRFQVKDVYDGDTLRLWIDVGFSVSVREKIRMAEINAPELRGENREKALKSRDYLRARLELAKRNGSEVTIRTIKDRKGKYGRYLGILYIDEECINETMLSKGFAEPYVKIKDTK